MKNQDIDAVNHQKLNPDQSGKIATLFSTLTEQHPEAFSIMVDIVKEMDAQVRNESMEASVREFDMGSIGEKLTSAIRDRTMIDSEDFGPDHAIKLSKYFFGELYDRATSALGKSVFNVEADPENSIKTAPNKPKLTP